MRIRSLALMLVSAAALAAPAVGCSTEDDPDGPSGPGTGASGAQGGSGGVGATGGGGSGGDGGEIIVEDSGEDTCPGDPYTLAVGQTLVLKGNTETATDDYFLAGFCGDVTEAVDSPDLVYAVTIPAAGTFTVELADTTGFLPAVSMRTACDDPATANYCFEFQVAQKFTKQHIEPGTYFVFIDGIEGTKGAYELTLSLDESVCGDGIIAPAEEVCDPLPVDPNDGCTDPGDPIGGCKLEMPDESKDTCPGEEVTLTTAGLTLLAADGQTTINYLDDYQASCQPATGGKDRVYRVVPDTTGTLTASIGFEADGATVTCEQNPNLEGCWDYALYARSTCDDTATELDCSDMATVEVISFPVTAATPYFIVVDGYDDQPYSDGTFNLVLTLVP